MSKRILITGSSGGFGKLTTMTLLNAGYKVAATMRNIEGKNKAIAEEFRAAGANIIELDVTDEKSVERGVNQAIEMLGGLDVAINNAGVGVLGWQEHFSNEDFQRLFDINVFGVQRVNRAVLPFLRNQKSGLLIHISSLLGRINIPFYGPYNASKWALEAMAENYRVELSGFGIDSCLVEPGGFPTTFMENLLKPTDHTRDKSYGESLNAPKFFFDAFEGALASNPAQNPQNVADAIVKLIETPAGERPMRTVVDSMGMGDHVKGYNEQLNQITTGIYNAFGIGDMLKLKTNINN